MGAGMRASDAFSWGMERDPSLRSTIVAIAWLEHSPDWAALRTRTDVATRKVPGFRMCVTPPGRPFAKPAWTDDPHFDLAWNLRRVDAPPPHTPPTGAPHPPHPPVAPFDPARPPLGVTPLESPLRGGAPAL